MSIIQMPMQVTGTPGINPNFKYMTSTDSLATITTAGYLNQPSLEVTPLSNSDVVHCLYNYNVNTNSGTYGIFTVSIAQASGTITLTKWVNYTSKVNGTEAANVVTANGNAGYITTSSLTTAGGASYAITWTNSFISATSVIGLTIQGGTNTTQNINFKVVAGAGTATLTIYNLTAATALNGTVIIGYSVV